MDFRTLKLDGKFAVGQIVCHQRHHYRGVIYDVDPQYMLPEEWYEKIATSKPAKDQPWYRILIDGGEKEAYVAEQNLTEAFDADPVEHPALNRVFQGFEQGRYLPRHSLQ